MKNIGVAPHFGTLIVITVLCGLIYATVQQTYRSSADDPQIQIALDIKNAIENNRSLAKWMTGDSVELSQSLSVFKTLYSTSGKAIQSSGLLNGHLPQLPHGVFDFTNKHQEDRLTWQPQYGVRMATVVEAVNSPQIGFVAVGRSLREIEKRESNLTTMVVVAWLICVGTIILHFLLIIFTLKKSN